MISIQNTLPIKSRNLNNELCLKKKVVIEQIGSNRKDIVQIRRDMLDYIKKTNPKQELFERLYDNHLIKTQRLNKMKREDDSMLDNMLFSPRINPRSVELARSVGEDIFKRNQKRNIISALKKSQLRDDLLSRKKKEEEIEQREMTFNVSCHLITSSNYSTQKRKLQDNKIFNRNLNYSSSRDSGWKKNSYIEIFESKLRESRLN